MTLPDHIVSRIMRYVSHPVADIFKASSYEYIEIEGYEGRAKIFKAEIDIVGRKLYRLQEELNCDDLRAASAFLDPIYSHTKKTLISVFISCEEMKARMRKHREMRGYTSSEGSSDEA